MRNQRAGQATFIPLDTIQVKPVNDKFRSFAKGARLAVDVILSEGAVERAIHHACGNALVCDTMEVARYVCYEKGQEIKGETLHECILFCCLIASLAAVTLEGTVIHKSGLITGGRSTHSTGKKWDEKDVQGQPDFPIPHRTANACIHQGLIRVRDALKGQLRDLSKQKPRGQSDENLISEVSRLETAITVARDDLVRFSIYISFILPTLRCYQRACKLRITGLKDELKHLEREVKKNSPELKKVNPPSPM